MSDFSCPYLQTELQAKGSSSLPGQGVASCCKLRQQVLLLGCLLLLTLASPLAASPFKRLTRQAAKEQESAIDRLIREMTNGNPQVGGPSRSLGSIFPSTGRFVDLGRDFRSQDVGDLVTVVVSDRASAVATGTTNSTRSSEVSAGISAIAGPVAAVSRLGQLAGSNSDTTLQGQGQTSRTLTLQTTVTAAVTHVLPNGNLVVFAKKDILVNSEHQIVELRGIVRPEDLAIGNQVPSDRVGLLEIRVNGKGVVSDAIRRPFILYRLLMGLLPI